MAVVDNQDVIRNSSKLLLVRNRIYLQNLLVVVSLVVEEVQGT
jgi:hypothetical protein